MPQLRWIRVREDTVEWHVQGEAGSWFQQLVEPKQIVVIGPLSGILRDFWPNAVAEQVILTGERRLHYLERHPEIRAYEDRLVQVAMQPDEIHRNSCDPTIAILYRRVARQLWLRLALWVSDTIGLQNSIHSYRLALESEVLRGRKAGRLLWINNK